MPQLDLMPMLKKRKLSKRQFALALGIRYYNVFRIFRPDANPRLSDLARYAKALNCRVRDLIRE